MVMVMDGPKAVHNPIFGSMLWHATATGDMAAKFPATMAKALKYSAGGP